MHRNRIDQTFFANDSRRRSFRAWRITSTGFGGLASSAASSLGDDRSVSPAAQALIHAANASYSGLRLAAWTAGAFASVSPIWIRARIFDFSGLVRSMSPWSRRERKVFSADGRM